MVSKGLLWIIRNDVIFLSFSLSLSALYSVLLLGCGIAEISLNIFISHINWRLAHLSVCRKWEQAAFFNNSAGLVWYILVGTTTRCYLCDFLWLVAAHSLTNYCHCPRKSHHFSSWAWTGIEQTIWCGLCLISVRSSRRVKEQESVHVSGGWWLVFILGCLESPCNFYDILEATHTGTGGSRSSGTSLNYTLWLVLLD